VTTTAAPDYEPVIGMEVHAELLTRSKMFCGCRTEFGAPPNSQCCPVCLGLSGSLPVPNRRAVELVMRTALALGCRITEHSVFHRKNYFYPDLPKAYQISQYDLPIGVDGSLDFRLGGTTHRVRIRRVHLEEDTGKLFHVEADSSFIDYNRSGVPLMEVVTEPDIHSADEARAYLQALRQVLVYLEVCDGRMEQGSLRCEPNISIRPVGSTELGTKVELKNLNSFRVVHLGVQAEVTRQEAALRAGFPLVQETRRWDEARGETAPMRTKEFAHDYRYFPEPDLTPLHLSGAWVDQVRAQIPELPEARRTRYIESLGLGDYDAEILTQEPATAAYFDEALAAYGGEAKPIANWVQSDLLRLLNADGRSAHESPLRPPELAELVKLVDSGVVTGKAAKQVFEEAYRTGRAPTELVHELGVGALTDESAIEEAVDAAIAAHPDVVETIRGGKVASIQFLVGQVMRATRGRARPDAVQRLLRSRLGVNQPD
jgi:aspartyl-tRNA(Asn)/glutamyl-tRNA(Gln) amidotransferase subunit B